MYDPEWHTCEELTLQHQVEPMQAFFEAYKVHLRINPDATVLPFEQERHNEVRRQRPRRGAVSNRQLVLTS